MSEPVFSLLSGKTLLVLSAVFAVAGVDMMQRFRHRKTHLFFAVFLGTALSMGLMRMTALILQPATIQNPFVMAAGVVLIVLLWNTLFGPWETKTKAAILGTFLFWLALHIFRNDSPEDAKVHLIAAATALVPAFVWCRMFLKYHSERVGTVILLFFAGILSTVPILFYDTLVRRGAELHFFFFTVKPQSFSVAAQTFVTSVLPHAAGMQKMFLTTMVSFVLVGLIEEVSKYWVVSRSGKSLFASIDDVLQLSIMGAIGFAFAENIINPMYFTAFVRDYLLHEAAPDLSGFFANVLGRSVLTSMVHIVSTGVMGYFLGLSIFASSYLEERHAQGKTYRLLSFLHGVLRMKETSIFRVQMVMTGLLSAIALHGVFNFMVTLPDLLPGNPSTLGDMWPSAPGLIGGVPFLLLPSLVYVVGGFWLLTSLFMRAEAMKERGHLQRREVLAAGDETEEESN